MITNIPALSLDICKDPVHLGAGADVWRRTASSDGASVLNVAAAAHLIDLMVFPYLFVSTRADVTKED